MATHDIRHTYGPVPSRRLGRSLGIDLVPFKVCTYDCIYCQLGRTTRLTLERKAYVTAQDIMRELGQVLTLENKPDYIALAGSGEPTLNSAIGDVIRRIKRLTDIPVDIISHNAAQRTPLPNTDNVREGDILAMLERRPCTAADVARGLGIHVNAALKHLAALVTAGQLGTVVNAGRNFYTRTGTKEQ